MGTTINPANEVAWNKSPTSIRIVDVAGRNICTKTRKNSEIEIVNKIFEINPTNDLLDRWNKLINSKGKNKINSEEKKNINPQKILWPDQVVILLEE